MGATSASAQSGDELVTSAIQGARGAGGLATQNAHAPSAQILLVNISEDWMMLAQAIGDLLLMHQVMPHFEHRRELTQQDLLEHEQTGKSNMATVWILMPQSHAARLVFADPQWQRFLVRDIPLPQRLDDSGCESIAQVIQSSVLSLLEGKAGMSRTEAGRELATYWTHSTESSTTVAPLEPLTSMTKRRALRLRLGAGYGVSLSGSDFGPQQGPAITSGFEFARLRDSFMVTAALEWRLQTHHRTSEFDLAVQSSFAWLLLGWRKPIRDTNLLLIAGPGLEMTRVNSQLVVNGDAASVSQVGVRLRPGARLAIGFEWDISPLTIQILGTLDATAYKTHYFIERNGTQENIAHTWSVQPGIALALLWR